MLRLADLRISWRIAIACLIPLLAFTAFAAKDLWDKREAAQSADVILAVVQSAPSISGLVHELQKERGASVGFVSSKGQSFADALSTQRTATDAALAEWQQQMSRLDPSAAGKAFADSLKEAQTALAELPRIRSAIDTLTIAGSGVAGYFSPTIAQLLATVESIGDIATDGRVLRQSRAFSAFLKRKEYAGLERAYGAQGFSAGEFPLDVYRLFVRFGALQDAQAMAFATNATPAQVQAINNMLAGESFKELARMRAIGVAAPFDPAAVRRVSGVQWFDTATKVIDQLKIAEDQIAAEFLSLSGAITAEIRWGFWSVLVVFIAMLAVTSILATIIALSITRPISRLTATMGALAQGNTKVAVPGAERGDEIGTMAKAVLVFRDAEEEKARLEALSAEQRRQADEQRRLADEQRQLAEEERQRNADAAARAAEEQARVVRSLGEGLNRLAEGDLTFRLNDGFTAAYQQIRDDFNAAIVRLQETMRAIAASTREVTNASAEISTSTTDLSQRTEEQAASLEETSASMEEISATVKKNAENAQQANQFASETRVVAERGGAVVAEAVMAMARIEESSRKISDIIGVIDEIARQTNLLALNAAVEAARAGEAGRGFAVVATEVRSLAQRSSQAAKDIKLLITNSSGQVKDGVELVNRAGTSLNEIVASIKKVADIVSDIAAASAEQAAGLEQVNKALAQMDEVTQQNSALVEENAATAKTLETQAHIMDGQVRVFVVDAGRAARAPRVSASNVVTSIAGRRGGPVGRMHAALATAVRQDSDWKEF